MAVERRVLKIWNSDDLAGSPGASRFVLLVPGSGFESCLLYQTFRSRTCTSHTQSVECLNFFVLLVQATVFNRFRLAAALSKHTSAPRIRLHFLLDTIAIVFDAASHLRPAISAHISLILIPLSALGRHGPGDKQPARSRRQA
jgi:hypothetical protein